ncbi:MAG: hypothetical protein J5862_01155, partial [Bacteroidales bacterium]|nr:hypothetical protein [Bacteroidales bacterium]
MLDSTEPKPKRKRITTPQNAPVATSNEQKIVNGMVANPGKKNRSKKNDKPELTFTLPEKPQEQTEEMSQAVQQPVMSNSVDIAEKVEKIETVAENVTEYAPAKPVAEDI